MAKIDLRGTPYAVDDSFDFGGYCATGNVVFSGDNQVADIKGGGHCGWMVPTKANNAGEVAAHLGGWFLKLKLLN